ncbi:hypothetical protein M378DRAFT_166828 [Amanita muscaria Koide BX008]|uniref:Uncharacterized protein n=1 Tax=Amanita muscaria (strain Koide BX008) TaxID=946122 RepID=A0A0C2T4U0_AMAMK|nr:hypothetical protein M378DRAFT_166828 [Amanita muscaria Koide BX008]
MPYSPQLVIRDNNSANDARLQHITLYFFVIYCVLLTFPQTIKAAIWFTNHTRPEENFRHRKLFISFILLTTIALVATYVQGAIITLSQFDTQLGMPHAVPAMYEFTKETSIEFFYAGLLLLLGYRGTASASFSRRWSFGLLLVMVLCSIINAPVSAIATDPSGVTASVSLRCIYFVAYFFLTILITFWSIRLHRESEQMVVPRELRLFDENVLSRIVKLISPLLIVRAIFELIALLIVDLAVFGDGASLIGFQLASVVIEGTGFFIMNTVALGLGSIERNRDLGEAMIGRTRSQIRDDASSQVPRLYELGADNGAEGTTRKHYSLYSSPSIDRNSVDLSH